jgi:hypothetical protein
MACYKGRTVSRNVLRAVHAANGDEMDFLSGGRRLKLKAKAWAILKDWRSKEGPLVDNEGEVEFGDDGPYEGVDDDDDEQASDEGREAPAPATGTGET